MMVRAEANAREPPEFAAARILDNESARQSSVLQPKTTNALKRPFDDVTTQEESSADRGPHSKRLNVSDNPAIGKTIENESPSSTAGRPKPRAKSLSNSAAKSGKTSSMDFTGSYELTCKSRYQPVNAENYTFKIHHQKDPTQQLFATFKFDNLEGVMRLCPQEALEGQNEQLLHLHDFEKGCILEEDIFPSREHPDWLMRWRGREGDSIFGGETRAQGQFIFKKDRSSKAMIIVFGMIHKSKHLLFEGVKFADLDVHSEPGWNLEEEWLTLFNKEWEIDTESDLESNSSYEKKPKNPPVGGIIKAKNKPGPNPGSIPVPMSPYIEVRPEWAWDITGTYELLSSGFAEALDIETPGPWSLTIHLANNPRHNKIGRQYWAQFRVGDEIHGIMRFCPATDEDVPLDRPFSEFEQACILEEGVWPSLEPQGRSVWHVRFIGRKLDSGPLYYADNLESSITLSSTETTRNPAGVELSGFLFDGTTLHPFSAHKTRDVEPRRPREPTVTVLWQGFQPRHRLL